MRHRTRDLDSSPRDCPPTPRTPRKIPRRAATSLPRGASPLGEPPAARTRPLPRAARSMWTYILYGRKSQSTDVSLVIVSCVRTGGNMPGSPWKNRARTVDNSRSYPQLRHRLSTFPCTTLKVASIRPQLCPHLCITGTNFACRLPAVHPQPEAMRPVAGDSR